MSETQTTTDALARLDGALSRIDAVIETVTRKLERSREEQETLVLERDIAVAELEELRGRHTALQAKADQAAERIDALISVVERALLAGAPGQDEEPAPAEAGPQDGADRPGTAGEPPAFQPAPQPQPQPAYPSAAPSAQPADSRPSAAQPGGFSAQGPYRQGY